MRAQFLLCQLGYISGIILRLNLYFLKFGHFQTQHAATAKSTPFSGQKL